MEVSPRGRIVAIAGMHYNRCGRDYHRWWRCADGLVIGDLIMPRRHTTLIEHDHAGQ